jgi:phage terminase small subunit
MGRKRSTGKERAAGVDLRRRRFAQEYVQDFNGAQAAIRAGYAKPSARQTASRLLTDADVQQMVAELAGKVLEAGQITVERIATEAAAIAFLDPADFYDDKGRLLPVVKMPERARRALAGFDVTNVTLGREDDAGVMVTSKIKHASKQGALALLADWRGMLKSATMLPPVLHLEIDMTGAKPAKG